MIFVEWMAMWPNCSEGSQLDLYQNSYLGGQCKWEMGSSLLKKHLATPWRNPGWGGLITARSTLQHSFWRTVMLGLPCNQEAILQLPDCLLFYDFFSWTKPQSQAFDSRLLCDPVDLNRRVWQVVPPQQALHSAMQRGICTTPSGSMLGFRSAFGGL